MAPLRGGARAVSASRQGATWTLDDHDLPRAFANDRVEAPWLIDGPINWPTFRQYIDEVLIPTLRPGDIVVMDNLGSHRSSASVRRSGPPVPSLLPAQVLADLNPIEMLFAKLKHGLRKAAKRTEQAIYDALVDLLPTVHQLNAPTTSPTQDMLELESSALAARGADGGLAARALTPA